MGILGLIWELTMAGWAWVGVVIGLFLLSTVQTYEDGLCPAIRMHVQQPDLAYNHKRHLASESLTLQPRQVLADLGWNITELVSYEHCTLLSDLKPAGHSYIFFLEREDSREIIHYCLEEPTKVEYILQRPYERKTVVFVLAVGGVGGEFRTQMESWRSMWKTDKHFRIVIEESHQETDEGEMIDEKLLIESGIPYVHEVHDIPFQRSTLLHKGSKHAGQGEILCFIDVDYKFPSDMADWTREHVVPGKQVFFPITLMQVWLGKYSTGLLALDVQDYRDSPGWFKEDATAWGMEDWDLFNFFSIREDFVAYRGDFNQIVHIDHPIKRNWEKR